MRFQSVLPVAVSLLASASVPLSAGTLYLSTAGNDSSPCTSSRPCATIQHASTLAQPGDTVLVAAGTYSGSFKTRASGTASGYITYKAVSADFSQPVNCAQVAANHESLTSCAQILPDTESTWVSSGDYVIIQGFDVTGPPGCCNAIGASGAADQIIGNHVHNAQNSNGCPAMGGAGIAVNGPNMRVIGNYVHNNGPYPAHCDYIQGIYVSLSTKEASGVIVENNISFDNSGWGIQLWHNATNETLVNNTLFNNLSGGIVVGASSATDDSTIVSNNISFNNCIGIAEEGKTGTRNTYTDNLVYQNPGPSLGCRKSHDNISLQNGNTATGTVSADPQFIHFTGDSTGDYHLRPNSPATSKNPRTHAPSDDFDGKARASIAGRPDITLGAYDAVLRADPQ